MDVSLHRLFLRRKILDQVLDTLIHDKISPGEKAHELVKALLLYLKCYRGWSFSTPMLAVRYLFTNLRLTKNETVVLSPLAPSYYREVLQELGVRVLFCDVLSNSPIFDFGNLEQYLIKDPPRAIILDSCLGLLPTYDLFQELGIFLIEDVTFGLGGRRQQKLAGTIGDAVIFSFFPQSLITCGQGALLAIRSKNHRENDFFQDPSPWSLLSDLNASLGISQWNEKDKVIEKKKENLRYLSGCLNQRYNIPKSYGECDIVPPWFIVLVEVGAKDIISYARKNGVAVDWAFRINWSWPSIEMDCFPNAQRFFQQALAFPLCADLTSKELELLGKILSTLP